MPFVVEFHVTSPVGYWTGRDAPTRFCLTLADTKEKRSPRAHYEVPIKQNDLSASDAMEVIRHLFAVQEEVTLVGLKEIMIQIETGIAAEDLDEDEDPS